MYVTSNLRFSVQIETPSLRKVDLLSSCFLRIQQSAVSSQQSAVSRDDIVSGCPAAGTIIKKLFAFWNFK